MDCRKCGADSECASDVCDVDAGTCTSSDLVLYASPTGSATSACAQSAPCTFDHAITVSFTTFINAPLKCTSTTLITVSDSILVNTGQDAVSGTGPACIVNDSILLPQTGSITGSNDHPNVDPLFKDKANGDFSLQSASPAIDAAPANATVPAVDFAGTARPQGLRADLGAFEYKP